VRALTSDNFPDFGRPRMRTFFFDFVVSILDRGSSNRVAVKPVNVPFGGRPPHTKTRQSGTRNLVTSDLNAQLKPSVPTAGEFNYHDKGSYQPRSHHIRIFSHQRRESSHKAPLAGS
jgi:hypothetical protein